MQKKYYVYIITNWRKTVLYTGVTNNLYRRIREHYANKGKEDTFAGNIIAIGFYIMKNFRT